jgi:hypothetical protein
MLEKTKKERDSLAQEKAMLKESLSKVQGEARLWQKEAEGLEKRLTLVQQDNQSLGLIIVT